MAMNDDMDELLRHYRQASNEVPSMQMDRRVLDAADRAASTRRWTRRIAWPLALAASLLLALLWPTSSHRHPAPSEPMAAYNAGMTRNELLRMDITPPVSAADRFVLNAPHSKPNPMTGIAP